ncbi:MAG TPA: hypothetical protein VHG51_17275 [Longimicrobiaceae bacterium]|nr:hypothetical protein [Longimicrobiaceae bacterium]
MRRSALAGLVLLCSACAVADVPEPAPRPDRPSRAAGVLTQTIRGRCGNVIFGTLVRRACLPRPRPEPADTAASDTTRTDPLATRVAAGGDR